VVDGELTIAGLRVPSGSPRRAVRAGLGLLTEHRKQLGLLLALSIRENTSLALLPQIAQLFMVNRRQDSSVVNLHLDG
jgi:ribose transport system ATP-binding protein